MFQIVLKQKYNFNYFKISKLIKKNTNLYNGLIS